MGTFDGIHLGHQKLLQKLRDRADQLSGEAIVVTYHHHPLETIHKKTFPYLLTDCDKKEKLLRKYGADCILYLNFDKKMSEMKAYDFLENILIKKMKMKELIVGYDTHFGKFREGNIDFLKKYENRFDYKIHTVEPYKVFNRIISSSLIRDFIREGDMLDVHKCLGRNYSLTGKIIVGQRLGRKIGFPTINISPLEDYKLIPAIGVYISEVFINEKKYTGVTNIGYSPTLKNNGIKEVETFILDFDEDVYGKKVEITFLKKIRDEIHFASHKELIQKINSDIEITRDYFC